MAGELVAVYSIDEVNALDRSAFVRAFGGVYEHSPWVAERAAAQRPFADLQALANTMQSAVDSAHREVQLALIRAHPELLGRLGAQRTLTAESRSEQAGAGLDHCAPAELEQLRSLNRAYREKFGFPFVVAVRGLARADIIARLAARINNEAGQEFGTNLAEIAKIARLRLEALVR